MPADVDQSLVTISNSVTALSHNEKGDSDNDKARLLGVRRELEKMDWIKHGTFTTMCKLFCVCGKYHITHRYQLPLNVYIIFLLDNDI